MENTELHVSLLGKEGVAEGGAQFTRHPMRQMGLDWASSDAEKQPKQEEGCEFMTKQNTASKRLLLEEFGQSAVNDPFS